MSNVATTTTTAFERTLPTSAYGDATRAAAVKYADAENTLKNRADALRALPEWEAILNASRERKAKGKGTMAAIVARRILGLPDDFATRVGPAGAQKINGVNGRRVESLASFLKKESAEKKEAEAGVLRVSLSGEGGGSTTVPADHPLYAALIALLAGDETSETSNAA